METFSGNSYLMGDYISYSRTSRRFLSCATLIKSFVNFYEPSASMDHQNMNFATRFRDV